MKNLKLVFAVIFALSIFQSCVKEDDTTTDVAPDLPPVESFVMSFDGFEDADTSGIIVNGGDTGFATSGNSEAAGVRTTTFQNWFYSATHVVVWNTILTINLAVPVAAFYESFNHQATYEGSGVWLWAYEVTGNDGSVYEAKLYGELQTDGVKWDMYISKVGGYTDVHWYTGTTSDSGNSATWTLNHQPNNPQSYLGVEYQKDNGNGMASIRYTNIIPGNANNGDYIEFRKNNDTSADYNRAYDIYKTGDNNLLEINWNAPNKNGRVKDEMKFGDTDWHCWDENLMDIDC